jgi:hypothetical protein
MKNLTSIIALCIATVACAETHVQQPTQPPTVDPLPSVELKPALPGWKQVGSIAPHELNIGEEIDLLLINEDKGTAMIVMHKSSPGLDEDAFRDLAFAKDLARQTSDEYTRAFFVNVTTTANGMPAVEIKYRMLSPNEGEPLMLAHTFFVPKNRKVYVAVCTGPLMSKDAKNGNIERDPVAIECVNVLKTLHVNN